ncbi:MAG: argininosuccinate lyase [Chloroflexota bacterium]|nr:argininosuccinate lyase [Dehalococcoidia bacterium]MDW8253796.1 argininosuccinate lyase [Chloroflexota bacterium]
MREKLWGGRFSKETDATVEAFTASIEVDRRLARYDIAGSIAHARMLAAQGIIPAAEADQIVAGLEQIAGEIERGEFIWRADREDVHLNIEARLAELIGAPAGRLHTARSRNDQVALDLRLWLRDTIAETIRAIVRFAAALVDQAERHLGVMMPGYTHLQRAQPILFSHHLLAYVEMLRRDVGRFQDCWTRADELPLGSGALAGVPYPLDRARVARELGFSRITRNSLDAVSDRDFAVEFAAAAALLMAHLSRFAEEVVLWTSAEFGFITLDDAFATGSSIMPQKKNPDVAELVRGKTGRVYGDLIALLTILKGLPLSYNRDLQEDKPPLFDAADTLLACLEVFRGLVTTWTVNADRMAAAISDDVLATDFADYLVRKGMPFRQAHEVAGRLVRLAEERGVSLRALTPDDLRQQSPLFGDDIAGIDAAASVAGRAVPGGTAPVQVAAALAEARRWIESTGALAE